MIRTLVVALVVTALPRTQQFAELLSIRAGGDSVFGTAVAVADFDRDSFPDAMITATSDLLRVFTNDATGNLIELEDSRLQPLAALTDLEPCDLDGDGDLDVAAVGRGLALYVNDGTGRFTDESTARLPGRINGGALAVADYDRDGDPDLVVIGALDSDPSTLLLNDGTGNFPDPVVLPQIDDSLPEATAGDLDGDGHPDVVVTLLFSTVVMFWDGTSFRTEVLGTDVRAPRTSVLGDIDGDGDLDVITLSRDARDDSTVFVNDGTGGLSISARLGGLDDSLDAELGDVDDDGDPDLVVSTKSTSPLRLLLNDGAGGFDPAPERAPRELDWAFRVALADLDLDGDLDALVGNLERPGFPSPRSRIYSNLHRHAHAPAPPSPGAVYRIELSHAPGHAPTFAVAVPVFGAEPAVLPLGRLGVLRLSPTAGVIPAPPVVVGAPGGRATFEVAVPNRPGLIGKPVYVQALLLSPFGDARLTNLVADVVGSN